MWTVVNVANNWAAYDPRRGKAPIVVGPVNHNGVDSYEKAIALVADYNLRDYGQSVVVTGHGLKYDRFGHYLGVAV